MVENLDELEEKLKDVIDVNYVRQGKILFLG